MPKLFASVMPHSESDNVMNYILRKFENYPHRIIREPEDMDANYYEIDFGNCSITVIRCFEEAIRKKAFSIGYASSIIGDALYGLYRVETTSNEKTLEQFIKEKG